jgi:hypothetical protein
MAKYEVEVGGFVNTFSKTEDGFVDRFRHRKLIIYANNEEEAREKAEQKFMDLCQKRPGNMCDEGHIDSVRRI